MIDVVSFSQEEPTWDNCGISNRDIGAL